MFDVCAGCERRGKAYEIFDWCAHCERSLCHGCMQTGCCENLPARSGQLSFKQLRGRLSARAQWLSALPSPDEPPPTLEEHFGGRCCARARAMPCSCAFHWVCPSHGDQHVGSHD
jgi:hypothetical protein